LVWGGTYRSFFYLNLAGPNGSRFGILLLSRQIVVVVAVLSFNVVSLICFSRMFQYNLSVHYSYDWLKAFTLKQPTREIIFNHWHHLLPFVFPTLPFFFARNSVHLIIMPEASTFTFSFAICIPDFPSVFPTASIEHARNGQISGRGCL